MSDITIMCVKIRTEEMVAIMGIINIFFFKNTFDARSSDF